VVPARETLQETFKLSNEFFEKPDLFIEDKEIVDWIARILNALK